MNYRIFPPEEIIECTLRMPRSKSIVNRALVIDALAGVPAPAHNADCADCRVMREAIYGSSETVDVGAAGTAMRFLTAYYAAMAGSRVTIDGSERMRQRPVGPLVDALRSLGATIHYLGNEGYPPLAIEGARLSGGSVRIAADVSSQFISALLMVAPTAAAPVTVVLEGDPVSADYVSMTVSMMRRQGITVEYSASEITVMPGRYIPVEDTGEGDWSSASYWYEIAALSAGWISLEGLKADSMQGDRRVADVYEALCVGTEWDGETMNLIPSPDQAPRISLDLVSNPDLAPAIAVSCCMLGIPFRLSGLSTLRVKETDRLEALCRELLKIGFIVEADDRGNLVWDGMRGHVNTIPSIHTYEDHRMAMAFAPVSLFCPGIEICDAEVVEKSYPAFWDDMRTAGFTVVDSADIPENLRNILE